MFPESEYVTRRPFSQKYNEDLQCLAAAFFLVAEWIHFTLFWIILPTIKLKVYTFGGLMNSATKGPESGSVLVFGPVSLRVVVLAVAGKTYLFRVPYSAWVGAKVLKQWVLVQCFSLYYGFYR